MRKQQLKLKGLTQGNNKKVLSQLKKSVKFKNARDVSIVGRSSDDKKLDAFFDNLITIEELADYIGVSQKTIRNWVAMRTIPFLRIGKKTFFIQNKIWWWLQTKEFEPCQ